MLSGDALQQSSSPFSESSLQGSSVFTQSGLANGSADVAIGQLSFDGMGAISGQLDENNGGVITTAAVLAGSYTTQSNGRALLNLINVKTQAVTSFVAYLIAPNSAFLLSMEPAVKIGALQPQVVAPPFSNGVAAGTFTVGSGRRGQFKCGTGHWRDHIGWERRTSRISGDRRFEPDLRAQPRLACGWNVLRLVGLEQWQGRCQPHLARATDDCVLDGFVL